MLVTFYTDAYENITFFGNVALQLLALMGYSHHVPGAIKASEVNHALITLKQNLLNYSSSASHVSDQDNIDTEDDEFISLNKRAIPLINLLNAANTKQCDVMWK